MGRHRDLAKNIAYSLAEHLRDHRFEPRFFNEILKANYGWFLPGALCRVLEFVNVEQWYHQHSAAGKDLYNSDLIDFKSIFLLPEESSSDNDDQPPHAPTAAIPRRCSATVVMTKNPNATGPCPVPENKRWDQHPVDLMCQGGRPCCVIGSAADLNGASSWGLFA